MVATERLASAAKDRTVGSNSTAPGIIKYHQSDL